MPDFGWGSARMALDLTDDELLELLRGYEREYFSASALPSTTTFRPWEDRPAAHGSAGLKLLAEAEARGLDLAEFSVLRDELAGRAPAPRA